MKSGSRRVFLAAKLPQRLARGPPGGLPFWEKRALTVSPPPASGEAWSAAALKFDAVEFLQHEVRALVGNIHQRLLFENLDAPDHLFRKPRHARDHADEISGRNLVGVAEIEGEPDHARLVRDGGRFVPGR